MCSTEAAALCVVTSPLITETAAHPQSQPTYSVLTWDHEAEGWDMREPSATKWELRRWLRTLYAESWDHVSILIQRND